MQTLNWWNLYHSACKSEDSVKQNLYNYVGESTSTFASEKGPPLADVERLKGNMRRELRNEKYPFNCTDFASPNLRIYTRESLIKRTLKLDPPCICTGLS